jgi:hypothetical protein
MNVCRHKLLKDGLQRELHRFTYVNESYEMKAYKDFSVP